jgi:hypothetical protein
MTNNARDPFCISMNPVLAVERNRRTPGLKIAAERAFGDHTLGLGVKHIDGLRVTCPHVWNPSLSPG